MKVEVSQGSTSWAEEFTTMDELYGAVEANPYNAEKNGYTVTNSKGEIIAENCYFLGMEYDEDEEEIEFTSEDLNEMNGVGYDFIKIEMALREENEAEEETR